MPGARAACDRAQGELAALERVIGTDEAEATGLRREMARLADKAAVTAGAEEEFDALAGGYARWEALTAERSRLHGAAAEYRALDQEVRSLETAIARERERLEGRQEGLVPQLATGNPTPVLVMVGAEAAVVEAEEARLEAALAPRPRWPRRPGSTDSTRDRTSPGRGRRKKCGARDRRGGDARCDRGWRCLPDLPADADGRPSHGDRGRRRGRSRPRPGRGRADSGSA